MPSTARDQHKQPHLSGTAQMMRRMPPASCTPPLVGLALRVRQVSPALSGAPPEWLLLMALLPVTQPRTILHCHKQNQISNLPCCEEEVAESCCFGRCFGLSRRQDQHVAPMEAKDRLPSLRTEHCTAVSRRQLDTTYMMQLLMNASGASMLARVIDPHETDGH